MESAFSLLVQAAFYSQDKHGIVVLIELGNEMDRSTQLLEWLLEIPDAGNVILAGGPGEASFFAGAPWLQRPPFVIDAHRGTGTAAIFFRVPADWRGELPSEPLRVLLKGRVFPSFFFEAGFDVCSLKTFRESPANFRPITANLRDPEVESAGQQCAREVFSLHGIRTRGKWQKEVVPLLSQADFHPVPLDFGYFMAIQLLFPLTRRLRIDWFRDEYMRQCDRLKCRRPSIIAHSFGTYLVAGAIEKYPQIVFDRIILSGSIVRPDFPWQAFISGGQVGAVLNQYGGRDLWVRAVEWVVADAGPSGGRGFDSSAGIIQQNHPGFSHSDYFYDLNYTSNWLPFLKGRKPGPAPVMPVARPNWKYRFTVFVLVVAMVITTFGLYRKRAAIVGKPGSAVKSDKSVTIPVAPLRVYVNAPKAVVQDANGLLVDLDPLLVEWTATGAVEPISVFIENVDSGTRTTKKTLPSDIRSVTFEPADIKPVATTRGYRKTNRIRAVAEWSTNRTASEVKDLAVGIEVELMLSGTLLSGDGQERPIHTLAAMIDQSTKPFPRDYCFTVDLVGWTKSRTPLVGPLRSCDTDTEVQVPALNGIDWSRPVGLVYNRPDDPRIVRTRPVTAPIAKPRSLPPAAQSQPQGK